MAGGSDWSQGLKQRLAPVVKPVQRRVRYRTADVVDRIRLRDRDGVGLPPVALRTLNGHRDFLTMGKAIVDDLVQFAGVRPGDRVLDLGCGAGRVAIPLIELLDDAGHYDGLDVVPEAIAWCRRHITPRHPNFRFHVADVRSDHYHPRGEVPPERYVFPFDTAHFDVVWATSVFTHLGAGATANYLTECARILRPGGRLFATLYLVDGYADDAIAARRTMPLFERVADGTYVTSHRDPEAAVAHPEDVIRSTLDTAGMAVDDPIRGNWNGRPDARRRQDILVARRR